MQLLDAGNQVPSRPTPNPTNSPGWANNDVTGGSPATIADPDAWNAMMGEQLAFLTATGQTPNKTNVGQMLAACRQMFSPVRGARKNLVIVNDATTPGIKVDITADEFVVEDSSGNTYKLANVSVSIAYTSSGANGLDTGTFAASTGYNHWIAYNPTTQMVIGLGSLASNATPTLPSGYTAFARVGWNHTDSTTNFYRVRQVNADAEHVPTASTNTAQYPALASGATSGPTAVSVSTFAPPTVSRVKVSVNVSAGSGNAAYVYSNTEGSVIAGASQPASGAANLNFQADVLVESGNIAWGSTTSGSSISLIGWTDNI